MKIEDARMEDEKFGKLVEYIKGSILGKYSIKEMVAEIYNLYQEYLISEEQEVELYKLVDSNDVEDCPAELWFDDYGCEELFAYAIKL